MTEKSRTYILLAFAILAGIAAIHSCKLPEVVPSPNALFSVEGFDCIQAEDGCLLTLLNSSEYGESFLWEIGDTTSTAFQPADIYIEQNCYTKISLTVTNESGEDSHSTSVITNVGGVITPTVDFDVDGYCVSDCSAPDELLVFTSTSSCANSFRWVFQSNSGSTPQVGESVSFGWNEAPDAGDTYTVTLTATLLDENGTDISAEGTTVVKEIDFYNADDLSATVAAFTSPHVMELIGQSASFEQVNFDNNSVNAESYTWEVYASDSPETLYASSTHFSGQDLVFEGNFAAQVDYDVYLLAEGILNTDTAFEKLHLLPNGELAAIFHFNGLCEIPCSPDIIEASVNQTHWEWYINEELVEEGIGTGDIPLPDTTYTTYPDMAQTYTLRVFNDDGDMAETIQTIDFRPANFEWECGEVWYDTRDGNFYNTVDINGSCFFAENLNFEAGGQDYVGTGANYCQEGFRYYDWDVAQSSCPPGWKIPTEADLLAIFGGNFFQPVPTPADLAFGGNSGFNAESTGLAYANIYLEYDCLQDIGEMYYWAMDDAGLPKYWYWNPNDPYFYALDDTSLINVSAGYLMNIRCLKEQ